MTDDELRSLDIACLQDSSQGSLLFLWVTGRAMDLGRELLKRWGYHQVDRQREKEDAGTQQY